MASYNKIRTEVTIQLYNPDTGEVFRNHTGKYNLRSEHDKRALWIYIHDFFNLINISDPKFDSFRLSFTSSGQHKDLELPF